MLNLPGIYAWYRSDLGITLTGSDVTVWADQSGNGRNLGTASGTLNPPSYDTTNSNFNNRPTLTFDAANTESLSAAVTGTPNGPWTAIGVQRLTLAGGGNRSIITIDGATNYWNYYNNATVLRIQAGGGAVAVTVAVNNTYISQSNDNTTNSFIGVNTLRPLRGNTAIASSAATQIMIGNNPDSPTSTFGGQMAELIICQGALDASWVQKAFEYLAARYNITLT